MCSRCENRPIQPLTLPFSFHGWGITAETANSTVRWIDRLYPLTYPFSFNCSSARVLRQATPCRNEQYPTRYSSDKFDPYRF